MEDLRIRIEQEFEILRRSPNIIISAFRQMRQRTTNYTDLNGHFFLNQFHKIPFYQITVFFILILFRSP